MSTKQFSILITLMILLIAFVLFRINQPGERRAKIALDSSTNTSPRVETSTDEIPEGFVKVGGVVRPEYDIKSPRENSRKKEATKGYQPGFTPKIAPDTNANTRSIFAARGDEEKAYRLSSIIPAPKFDKKKYEDDAKAYLDEVAPARVWQALPPSQEVTPIQRAGNYFTSLIQGEAAVLRVKVTPRMPVTFYSPKLGQFDNQLSSITVQANENGVAKATFRASLGTRGEIDVIASSPVHSDYARWLVEVLPQEALQK